MQSVGELPNNERRVQAPKKNYTVKQQVVAGFVVFRRTEEGIKFLLLYKRGQYWNFPKGHFEAGEDSMATALRETHEETGIKKEELRIIPGFRTYEKFQFRQGEERIHDTVILYLAETRKAHVVITPREHSGFAWFTYQDALKALGKKYVATQRVLKQAYDFIRRASARRGQSHPARQNAHIRAGGTPGRIPPRPPSSR